MIITHKHEIRPKIHAYFKQVYGAVTVTQTKFDKKTDIYSAWLLGSIQQDQKLPAVRGRTVIGRREVSAEELERFFNKE
jgi:hypothetical protein